MMSGTWRADNTDDQYDEDESFFVNNVEDCPICYGETQLGLKTNCGHVYCGECILAWVHLSSNGLSPMLCPYCRQKVTTLVPCFNEDERNNQEWAEIETRILEEAGQYNNRRFSEEPAEIRVRILQEAGQYNRRIHPSIPRLLLYQLLLSSINLLITNNHIALFTEIFVYVFFVFLICIK